MCEWRNHPGIQGKYFYLRNMGLFLNIEYVLNSLLRRTPLEQSLKCKKKSLNKCK